MCVFPTFFNASAHPHPFGPDNSAIRIVEGPLHRRFYLLRECAQFCAHHQALPTDTEWPCRSARPDRIGLSGQSVTLSQNKCKFMLVCSTGIKIRRCLALWGSTAPPGTSPKAARDAGSKHIDGPEIERPDQSRKLLLTPL